MAFNQFPYSNFHELNLDWILNQVKENTEKVDQLENSVPDAINSAVNAILTPEKIQEIVTNLTPWYSNYFAGKKIHIFGDSISSPDTVSTLQPVWALRFADSLSGVATVVNHALPGMTITGSGGVADQMAGLGNLDADIVILFAGVNDFRLGRNIGTISDTTFASFSGALRSIRTTLENRCPKAQVFVISPLKCYQTSYPDGHIDAQVLPLFRRLLFTWAQDWGYNFIDGFTAPLLNPSIAIYRQMFQPDGLHPLPVYTSILNAWLTIKMASNANDTVNDITTIIDITPYIAADTTATSAVMYLTSGTVRVKINVSRKTNEEQVTIATFPTFLLPSGTVEGVCRSQVGTQFGASLIRLSEVSGALQVRCFNPEVLGTVYHNIEFNYPLKNVNIYLANSL